MRMKSILFLLATAFLAIFVFLEQRGGQNLDTVERLSRLQRQQRASAEPSGSESSEGRFDSSAEEFLPNSLGLIGELTAERGKLGTWFLHDPQESTTLELPFPPSFDGALSLGHSLGDTQNSHDQTVTRSDFVGADACAECHHDEHSGFAHTSHYNTSGLVDKEKIRGSFSPPKNRLNTSDPSLFFTMTKRGDQVIQSVSFADWHLDFPMDVFTGSAKSGKTFLYWHQDALFQSHVSYLSQFDEWIPSPGFPDTAPSYARRIRLGCLECHITHIDRNQGQRSYDRNSAIWGISCERCHGPGRQHIDYHIDHPDESIAKHIVHPASLPRARQLDICGQCHSGSFDLIGDAFSFRPGDELTAHHKAISSDSKGVGSIHTANQLTRLSMSKCFQQSEMTCTSCHDPHMNQRGVAAVFTESCLSCHQPTHCGMSQELGERVADDCVSCHMPIGDNDEMTLQVSGGIFTMLMIDHYIRVDQDATDRFLAK